MTKLTPALIEQIRAKAAQGFSAHQTAAALGLDRSYLVKQAGQLGIRFNKLPTDQMVVLHGAEIAQTSHAVITRRRTRLSAELRAEIAAAKAEAATAPLFMCAENGE
jgi:uncharacterized protein YqjF (DUF2071 family)